MLFITKSSYYNEVKGLYLNSDLKNTLFLYKIFFILDFLLQEKTQSGVGVSEGGKVLKLTFTCLQSSLLPLCPKGPHSHLSQAPRDSSLPGSDLAKSGYDYGFTKWRNWFPSVCTICSPHLLCLRVPDPSHPPQYFLPSDFLILIAVQWYPILVLIYTSLMIDNIEHLCISTLVKYFIHF